MKRLSEQLRSEHATFLTRRWFLRECGVGLGGIAAASLLATAARRGDVMVPFTKVENVASVTWVAVGWIALETLVGWAQVWVDGKLRARAAAKAARATPPPQP